MVKFLWFLRGYVILEICGAAPQWTLNSMTKAGVAFWNVQWVDPLTVRVCVFRSRVKQASELATKSMCDCRVAETRGIRQSLGGVFRRPMLLLMLLLTAAAVLVVPQFVLFYEVVGNETIPDQQILRELNDLGIGFGTYGPKIRPAWVKNHLLKTMPQLQWVTVTQNGCRAQVVVRERIAVPETNSLKGFANVIATQSGMITQQSVYAGQAQFKVGDMVSKGDVLVSGVVDLERIYVLENARAEIFARTWRQKAVVIPSSYTAKKQYTDTKTCIWLIVGRKRIKIFGNSGISYGSCDKMITNKELQLPEQLEFPVSLEIETFRFYQEAAAELEQAAAEQLLTDYTERTVSHGMRAGQILERTYAMETKDGCHRLSATLECHEMIAEAVAAKWNNEDFVND